MQVWLSALERKPATQDTAFCTGYLRFASSVVLPVSTVVGAFIIGIDVIDSESADVRAFFRRRILVLVGIIIIISLTCLDKQNPFGRSGW